MQEFVGVWSLIDYITRGADDTVGQPLGIDPYGIGVYTSDGWMSAHLMRRDRTPFGTGRRPGIDPIEPDIVIAAAAGYIGYSGRYTVDHAANTVSHHVESALIPDWVGTVQVRNFAFADGILTLRPPIRGSVSAVLRWRRP